jgi:predicted histone-like DNA-binding protein
MGIPFKKIMRKNPQDRKAQPLYYPHLVRMGKPRTLEAIAYDMTDRSSLSAGDIQSVITNFVHAMIQALYNGQSVNIAGFGVFRLTAKAVGVKTREDCTAKCIKGVNIRFRPSSSVHPDPNDTRAGYKMDFYDIEAANKKSDTPEEGGGSEGGGGEDNPFG